MDALTNFIGGINSSMILAAVFVGMGIFFVVLLAITCMGLYKKHMLKAQTNLEKCILDGVLYVKNRNGDIETLKGIDATRSLKNLVLRDLTFEGRSISNCTFSNCTIIHCIFNHASLEGCRFEDCKIVSSDFRHSKMSHTSFWKCKISSVYFNRSDMSLLHMDECDVDNTGFQATFLDKGMILNSSLVRCGFQFANYDNTEFHNTEIVECSFTLNENLGRIAVDDKTARYLFNIVLRIIGHPDTNALYPALLENGWYQSLVDMARTIPGTPSTNGD